MVDGSGICTRLTALLPVQAGRDLTWDTARDSERSDVEL